MVVHSQPMDHTVRSLVNANAAVAKSPILKKCIKSLRVDGPQFWDGSKPTRFENKMKLVHHPSGLSYYYFAVPRVDDGKEVKTVDHHSYLIGWNLYFRSNKARDLFFDDLEFAEMNNTMVRGASESHSDFMSRFKVANRKTAIRRGLNRIARVFGKTLVGLEHEKVIYNVAGRSA